MTPRVSKALKLITDCINVETGLTHFNDNNRTKDMFRLLHEAGETLNPREIEEWARANGWQDRDAREVGRLAGRIGGGAHVVIQHGPWWRENILKSLDEADE
jgi:hypothetical protein